MLSLSAFSTGICSICFGIVETDVLRGVAMFLMSVCYVAICVIVNLAVIEAFRHDGLNGWLQVNHGAFGVGGLIAPLIVK